MAETDLERENRLLKLCLADIEIDYRRLRLIEDAASEVADPKWERVETGVIVPRAKMLRLMEALKP